MKAADGKDDYGTSVSAADRTRARRVVQTTVFIRNRMSGWDSLQAP